MPRPATNTPASEEKPKKRVRIADIKRSLRVYRFIEPYKALFITGLIFLLGSSLTSLAFPLFTGKLVDASKVIQESEINRIALTLGAILLIQGVLSYFRIYIFSIVTEKVSADLRFSIYNKLTRLQISYFDSHRIGELTSRLTNDVSQLQDTMSTTLAEFFRQIATLIIGVAIIFFLSTKLTLFMLSTFPVMVIIAFIFGRFIRSLSKQKQDELASANIVVEETLQAIKVVKAFTNELMEVRRYKSALDKTVETALKVAKYRAGFVSFIITGLFGGIVLVLWYGARLVMYGELSVGELTSFIIYTTFIGGAVGGLGDLYSQIQKTIGSSERILEILDEPVETSIEEKPSNKLRFKGKIEFSDVNFSYPSRDEVEVLKHITFSIDAGEKIAIVGPSGSGKTTITQLLLKFYQSDSGTILIDGRNIDIIDYQELRSNTGIVPQETLLFGGSIRENIAYGKPGASLEEIQKAADQANASEFIDGFPDKYDTIVGERGIQLSGGQRQRIAIARAILKDPTILILDEATSSLDAESESLVQEALDKLMVGRTSIIVAHRLSTIRKADRILVLKQGEIIEGGSHEALLRNKEGLYSHLVGMQMEW